MGMELALSEGEKVIPCHLQKQTQLLVHPHTRNSAQDSVEEGGGEEWREPTTGSVI